VHQLPFVPIPKAPRSHSNVLQRPCVSETAPFEPVQNVDEQAALGLVALGLFILGKRHKSTNQSVFVSLPQTNYSFLHSQVFIADRYFS